MVNRKIAWRRFTRKGTKLGLAALFIAIIQATLVITNASLPLVQAQAIAQQIENLPKTDRWISINLGDATQLGNQEISEFAVAKLQQFDQVAPAHFITFRPISDQVSGRYQLIGIDNLNNEIELLSGELPKNCDSQMCEVLVVNPEGLTNTPSNFKIVGTAVLQNDSPISNTIEQGITLLITTNANNALTVESTKGFPGSESWSIPISQSQIENLGLANFLNTANEISSELSQKYGLLILQTPSGVLDKTKSQIEVLFNRILSLELVTILVGSFSILLISRANRMRNSEFVSAAKRLDPKKISKFRLDLQTAISISIVGSIIGIIAGFFSFAILTKQIPTFDFNYSSLLIITTSSTLLIFCGLSERIQDQLVSLSLATAIWVTYINSEKLQTQIVLIGLICAFASLFIVQIRNRTLKSKFVKNTVLSNQGAIIALALITTFLATSILSALMYLKALERNAFENAIYKSPTLTRITMGGEAQPMQNNSFADYQDLTNNGQVFPVTKVATTFQENVVTSFPTQLIGVSNDVWSEVPDISTQTKVDLRTATKSITKSESVPGFGLSGSKQLSVSVVGLNEFTSISAWVLNNRSESFQVELMKSDSNYVLELPSNAASLMGFQITELPDYKSRREHAVNEGKNALPVPIGNVVISDLKLDEVTQSNFSGISNSYSLINGPVYFPLTKFEEVIPAIVDPLTAKSAKNSEIQLRVSPFSVATLKIVGVANNLPTVQMRFALIDHGALMSYLAAKNPELVKVTEVWLTNELTKGPDLTQKLYGLTIYDQKTLIKENFSPTNATWTKRGIQLLIVTALAMFLVLIWFVLRTIYSDRQLDGWILSGRNSWQLLKSITLNLSQIILITFVVSLLGTLSLTPLFIERLAFDINGVVANPPLAVEFDLLSNSFELLVTYLLVVGLVFSYSRYYVKKLMVQ